MFKEISKINIEKRIRFLGCLYAAGVVAATIGITAYRVSQPTFVGVMGQSPTTWRGQAVLPVLARGLDAETSNRGTLHTGDLVIALNNRSVDQLSRDIRATWRGTAQANLHPSQPMPVSFYRGDVLMTTHVVPAPLTWAGLLRHNVDRFIVSVLMLGITFYIFSQRPTLPAAQAMLMLGAGLFATDWANSVGTPARLSELLHLHTLLPGVMLSGFGIGSTTAGLVHLAMAFPEKQLGHKQRWVRNGAYLLLLGPWTFIAQLDLALNPNAQFADLVAGRQLLSVITLGAIAYFVSQIVRALREARSPLAQQKLRALVGLWVLGAVLYVGLARLPILLGAAPQMPQIVMLIFPLALVYALHKQQTFGVDLFVNRVLVYGFLSLFVIAGYMGVVVVVAHALHEWIDLNRVSPLIAAVLIALAFEPARRKLQTTVNRLMYGNRFEPYRVINQVSTAVAQSPTAEQTLPNMLAAIAQQLRLPYVAVQLHPEGRLVHVAEFGTPCAGLALHAVPLVHSGMVLGELVLSVRAKGDTFGARDAALLSDLAQHMGVVAFALLMHNNLQQARQRLAHSREDERRKVQRDLHDGLGQQLGGLLLMLGVAQKQMAHKPDAVAPLLSDLQAMTTDIVSELRDMLAQLRPPLLQQYGFATGLRQLVSQSQQAVPNLCIHAHICDGLPALPSPIEVAAYRIVQEALNNVLKHANATRCNVSVSTCDQTGCLWLRISDDGVGAGAQGVGNGTGLGLQTMRERAEELGGRFSMSQPPQGGTLVEVWFDLRAV